MFDTRHLLITGGSGFLGCDVTKLALSRGAHVTVPCYREKEKARLEGCTGDLSEEARARLHIVPADLTDEDAMAKIAGGMDRIDGLVHLVGGFMMGPTAEVSLADFRAHVEVNLTTTFLAVKHALPKMLAADYGRIVTVGSRAVMEPMAQAAVYSAAKAGVVALTRSVAVETKGTGVTANAVLPSIIDTPPNRAAMGEADAAKWVSPRSLAEVILFYASEAAGDIRGDAIPVYGNV